MGKELLKKALGWAGKKGSPQDRPPQPEEKRPLSTNWDENQKNLREVFSQCADAVFQETSFNAEQPLRILLVYLETLTDQAQISQTIIKSLQQGPLELPDEVRISPATSPEVLQKHVLSACHPQTSTDLLELTKFVLGGNIGILIEGSSLAVVVPAQGGQARPINEPENEPNIRGPRDGFVESLKTNISLIRRRLRTSRLKVETLELGLLTKTAVAVCYVEGLARPEMVEEVRRRLRRINVDAVLGSGYVEEFIADESISLFPLILTTERPDRVTAALLEGRIGILVENSPSTMVVPCTFISLLQASEDYYVTAPFSTFIRLLRFVALNIALLLPAVTVAVFSFHQELVPVTLLSTVSNTRQDVPFPIFIEVLLMEVTFELLREAGLRLPKTIGQAVSTVGGLVIGQAAVEAGYFSPLPVIVVALTAIASFTAPNYIVGTSIRILRFFLLILAALLGGVGIMLGLMAILAHLTALRSFGIPYLSPFAPMSPADLKDSFVRVPWWAMITRPRLEGVREPQRQDPDQGPKKPERSGIRKGRRRP
ncbi:Bacillus/Clostridium Ger spore germination protein [Acididesulfobacillus acetoxydans]|uniref:Bacillus/Clostridium Ger spore germination protein n=1 Tax=Acididesulfobacillus acetoxydans TaxID=1561005 RepID=A0A8S0X5H0_9FIRM|nr:spore germination protein [Acididesulfobacillus acetoxydans]CAA7601640.1 Bacillus/Clostridium Ger spore germination protein [Acididesulfobacillus acetoxydans]CEJ07127.1 Spore germination protein KA [Acididesulfobacillus acetoxydans]